MGSSHGRRDTALWPALQITTNVSLKTNLRHLFVHCTTSRRNHDVSKQLAISASFSAFAMVAFALLATPGTNGTGAEASAPAPALIQVGAQALPDLR